MITKSAIQSAILDYSAKLDYKGTETSHEIFMTIFLAIMRDNDLIAKEDIGKALAIWEGYPKNPSAFKQDVAKWLAPQAEGGVSSKATRFMDLI